MMAVRKAYFFVLCEMNKCKIYFAFPLFEGNNGIIISLYSKSTPFFMARQSSLIFNIEFKMRHYEASYLTLQGSTIDATVARFKVVQSSIVVC